MHFTEREHWEKKEKMKRSDILDKCICEMALKRHPSSL
jgi:hypothetical protein